MSGIALLQAPPMSDRGRLAFESQHLDDLLVRVAGADRQAFAALYDATSARVYGVIVRTLRNPAYSEETAQDVYLQIWRTARDFDAARGSALSWIITMAHRRAIDRVRSEQSGRVRDTAFLASSGTTPHDEVSETVTARLESAEVRGCLQSLTDKQREAIDLAYYRGLTYPEVAEHVGAALPTVKSRIRDGLISLGKCLGVTR
ncbi:ECF RNA polymerase sigma factor SigK [Smaragdicoccus niigatensis]|uniref:ECF RNA polymerase sigma factor SigK n=1 Tax=Smaragdicoccus niigatensis TaxID=359359 RepID=UPI00039F6FE2